MNTRRGAHSNDKKIETEQIETLDIADQLIFNNTTANTTVDLGLSPRHILTPLDKHEVSIIIPTYQEVLNIKPLSHDIHRVMVEAGLDKSYEIIFVDDNSNDGTLDAVDQLVTEFDYPLKLIIRTAERGLSSAVLRGFDEARYETLLVMDADMQHQPKYIPTLLNPIFAGIADFSIGSRHTRGGSIEGWAMHRKLISWGATFIARPLIPACTDPMSGFFALTKHTLQRAKKLNPLGYKIGLELAVRCRPYNIVEIPIVFRDRQLGESKLNIKTHLYYLLHVGQLYVDTKQHYIFILGLLLLIFVLFLNKKYLLRDRVEAVEKTYFKTNADTLGNNNNNNNNNNPYPHGDPSIQVNNSLSPSQRYSENNEIITTPTLSQRQINEDVGLDGSKVKQD